MRSAFFQTSSLLRRKGEQHRVHLKLKKPILDVSSYSAFGIRSQIEKGKEGLST